MFPIHHKGHTDEHLHVKSAPTKETGSTRETAPTPAPAEVKPEDRLAESQPSSQEIDHKTIDSRYGPPTSSPQSKTRETPTDSSKGDAQNYQVKKGDTLWGILAQKGFSPNEIINHALPETLKLNGLADANTIKTGQTLHLPEKADANKAAAPKSESAKTEKTPGPDAKNESGRDVHTVKKGDTISGLLHQRHWSAEQIKDLKLVDQVVRDNNLKDADHLEVGQKLQLPGSPVQSVDDQPTKSPAHPKTEHKEHHPTQGGTTKPNAPAGSTKKHEPTQAHKDAANIATAKSAVHSYLATNGGHADAYDLSAQVDPKDPGQVHVTAKTHNAPGIVGGETVNFSVVNGKVKQLGSPYIS